MLRTLAEQRNLRFCCEGVLALENTFANQDPGSLFAAPEYDLYPRTTVSGPTRQPFHFARQCSLKEPAEKPYPNYSHLPTFSNHGIAIDVIMRFTFVQDLSPSRIISWVNYGILRRLEFHRKRLRLELTNAFRHLRMERSQSR